MRKLTLLAALPLCAASAVFAADTAPYAPGSAGSGQSAAEQPAQQQPEAKIQAKAKPAKRVNKMLSEQFRQDLAACDALVGEERRDCRRETFAARDEGLYSG